MSHDEILLNKVAIIERCIKRIREEQRADPKLEHQTHVDALTLNIERACQACIDMAMHIVAKKHLGVPQSSAGAFLLLEKANVIDTSLSRSLQGMTGFRNVAIHEYQELNTEVLEWIVRDGWKDWQKFCRNLGYSIAVDK